MLFKPTTTKLWDTFVLHHDGRFYLYYLQLRENAWDGYGLAVSDDLIHWEDRGTILATEPGEYMGSGMVWRAGDKWILNFSNNEEMSQRIHFAESDDLLTWRKLPKSIICAPDPKWYECTAPTSSSSARWDNIWAVPQKDGSFLGFVVASGKDAPAGANGVVALVSSPDGIHWTTHGPVSEPCDMVWAEAGCHIQFDSRHYLLVGSSSGLGPRFDPVYNTTGKSGGMFVMMADDIRGPYRLVKGDPLLLGCRNAPANWAYIPTYYARVLDLNGQRLLYHHWMPRADFLESWLGTMKLLEEESPGKLVLKYWSGNDKLKGPLIFDAKTASTPKTPFTQAIPSGTWEFEAGKLTGRTASTMLAFFESQIDYEKGVVVEAEIKMSGNGAAGLFFGIDEQKDDRPYEGMGCLANRRGLFEFGRVMFGIAGPTFMPENHILREVREDTVMRWRVLLRGEFVELYVDDRLVQCYGFSKPAVKNIGIFAERCNVEVSGLKVYSFA